LSSLDKTIITRFAPSPTGSLHLGHAFAATQVMGAMQSAGRTALLRIEDIDHTRCRPEFIDGIYEDLSWLGFDWARPVRIQSQHYSDYAKVVITLMQRGLAYPCHLTRTDLKAGKRTPRPESSPHGMVAKLCDKIWTANSFKTPSLPFAIRLNLKTALNRTPSALKYQDGDLKLTARLMLEDWAMSDRPDPIIARRDIATSYHIAVTHDDHLQGINHIIRGADFVDQTPLHVLIQSLMGWSTPTYSHHPLITDDTGRKLSKSAKDLTIQSLRENGKTPADVLASAMPPRLSDALPET